MVQVSRQRSLDADGSINLDVWLNTVRESLDQVDIEPLRLACHISRQAMERAPESDVDWGTGSNSYYAGLEMAEILAELRMDRESLIAAVLYRAVREHKLELLEVKRTFGATVADLIQGVQQMAAISAVLQNNPGAAFGRGEDQTDNIRKMLVTMVDDVRIALIKLAERTCAIRAAKNASSERRQRVATEVFNIYAPLAHRLGVGHIKWELEDIAFRYLQPDNYSRIAELLDERRLDRERYVSAVTEMLEERLHTNDVEAIVNGRAKHIYSIWRKMQRKSLSFSEVYDIRAVRVLVPNLRDCYAALGIVHSLWRHIPREFDDYIATPKKNGYRSLHTAVIGPEGKVLEVQIRTRDMHDEAEYGVCSHWQYKGSDKTSKGRGYEEKIEWLRQVLQWHEEVGDLSTLADELISNVESDRVYVFTPAGHVVDLANGATPIDFAYRVHTEVGHHCRGAKVNGRIVPLSYSLKTGEQVEVLTSKQGVPSRDWLNPALGYVQTPRARAKILHWFKFQDRDKNIEAGRTMVNRELQRVALDGVNFEKLAPKVNYKCGDDMFAAVGAGDLRLVQVVNAAQQQVEPRPHHDQLDLGLIATPVTVSSAPDHQAMDFDGVGDLLSHIAGCCKPVPGDDCLGFITVGRGVSIHRKDCANIERLQHDEPERVINVHWGEKQIGRYAVDVLIRAVDRPALLRDVTSILANEQVNVSAITSITDETRSVIELKLTVEVPDLAILGRVLTKVGQLPNMIEVKRYKQGG